MKNFSSMIVLAIVMAGSASSVYAADTQQQAIGTSNEAGVNTGLGQGSQTMTTDELERRGKQLRAEIDKAWVQSNASSLQNYISDLVTKYIQVGVSFEDAEAIMHNAGLQVHTQNFASGETEVIGVADYSKNFSFSNAEVIIALSPKIPKDFNSGVGKVVAFTSYAAP